MSSSAPETRSAPAPLRARKTQLMAHATPSSRPVRLTRALRFCARIERRSSPSAKQMPSTRQLFPAPFGPTIAMMPRELNSATTRPE